MGPSLLTAPAAAATAHGSSPTAADDPCVSGPSTSSSVRGRGGRRRGMATRGRWNGFRRSNSTGGWSTGLRAAA